ncbi:TPA: nucleotidyl transferase AbiEii/AbiGii toxin family protein [Candidatus Micrarchaeota archaeon]|nr:nucleotidyl transferase AbiEii/AbiGii toxin family protein [Candidatus Micrarchaeota archaeon]
MLDRKDLNKFGSPGFNLSQKEKDYLQHWSLRFLSQSGFSGVFKGGTCLQKAFNLPRYSEDLDFTLDDSKEPDFDSLAAFLNSAGFSVRSHAEKNGANSTSVKLRARGPLYNGAAISEATITFDFSKREKTLFKPVPTTITPSYPDLLPYSIRAMDEREITAEKIRAIITRSSARDLFDLYFLLHRNSPPDKKTVDAKLSFYSTSFDFKEFAKRVDALEKIWKKEITALTPNYLEYGAVAKEVKKQAKITETA